MSRPTGQFRDVRGSGAVSVVTSAMCSGFIAAAAPDTGKCVCKNQTDRRWAANYAVSAELSIAASIQQLAGTKSIMYIVALEEATRMMGLAFFWLAGDHERAGLVSYQCVTV